VGKITLMIMYEKHEDGNGNIIKISRSFYDLSHLIYPEMPSHQAIHIHNFNHFIP
jgi:hypothetical protein